MHSYVPNSEVTHRRKETKFYHGHRQELRKLFLWYTSYIKVLTLDFTINPNIVRFRETRTNPIDMTPQPQPRRKAG